MSDATRTPDEYVKRAPTPTNTAAKTLIGTVAIATGHWVFKCITTGHWVYLAPDDALVEMWILSALPLLHFGINIIGLIGDAITARAERLAGKGTAP